MIVINVVKKKIIILFSRRHLHNIRALELPLNDMYIIVANVI